MNSYTLHDYRQWHWLWTPFFPVNGLFLVRYPGDRLQMTKQLYHDLSKLRVQALIDEWINQTGASRLETHQLLCQALSDEPMSLSQLPIDSEAWRQAWADFLIEANPTFWQKLSHQMDRHFPFQLYPPLPSEQERLRSLYQKMHLNSWLNTLVGG